MDNYPLVILINNGSASASEIVAGALKDHGKLLYWELEVLEKVCSVNNSVPENGAIRLTTSRYYTLVAYRFKLKVLSQI